MKTNLEKAENAVKIATSILETFDEQNVPIQMAFAVFGNGFSRVAFAMGFSRKEFKKICLEMTEKYDPKDENG